jgi:hypothetical protein
MAIAMPAGASAAVVSAVGRIIAGTTPAAPSTAGDPATLVPTSQAAAGKWKRIADCRPGLRGEASIVILVPGTTAGATVDTAIMPRLATPRRRTEGRVVSRARARLGVVTGGRVIPRRRTEGRAVLRAWARLEAVTGARVIPRHAPAGEAASLLRIIQHQNRRAVVADTAIRAAAAVDTRTAEADIKSSEHQRRLSRNPFCKPPKMSTLLF